MGEQMNLGFVGRGSRGLLVVFSVVSVMRGAPVSGGVIELPKTGQISCWDEAGTVIPCTGTGQDGDYDTDILPEGQEHRFVKRDSQGEDLSDDAAEWSIVYDNVTNLEWEVKQDKNNVADYSNPHDTDNKYTWYDSNTLTNGGDAGTPGEDTDTKDFLKALNDDGYGGDSEYSWRLPTVKELAFIGDRGEYNPSINTSYFPHTADDEGTYQNYWSSVSVSGTPYIAWTVKFNDARVEPFYDKSQEHYARAVRGKKLSYRGFINDKSEGTVIDISTGLMWQKAEADDPDEGNRLTWQESLDYCKKLNDPEQEPSIGSYDDWRLPSINEFQSLFDYTKIYDTDPMTGESVQGRAIDIAAFPDVTQSYYFSSSTSVQSGKRHNAWCIMTSSGYIYRTGKTSDYPVRVVRGPVPTLFPYLIQALKTLAGIETEISYDINSDGKLGLEEIVSLLQIIAE